MPLTVTLRCLCTCLVLFCALVASAVPPPAWQLQLTESEWLAPNIIRVPFKRVGTLIAVRARVDGQDGNFFFDTGASRLLLNHRYFSRYESPMLASAAGVTGEMLVLGSARVDTFLMDNLLAARVQADIIDLTHIETAKKVDLMGIIGFEVFKDFEVVFDYVESVLLLVRLDKNGDPLENIPSWEYAAEQTFPLSVKGHVAMIQLRFGETLRWFGLDSGAEQNLLDKSAGKEFLKNNYDIHRRTKLRGMDGNTFEVLAGNLKNAALGDSLFLRPMATLLTNLDNINAVYQTNLDGILGFEFLSQGNIGINYKRKRLTFYKATRA